MAAAVRRQEGGRRAAGRRRHPQHQRRDAFLPARHERSEAAARALRREAEMTASPAVRRARPLLGTMVEIAAWGGSVDNAFRVMEALQARLSFHDPASELSTLNRLAHRRAVAVGSDLWRV